MQKTIVTAALNGFAVHRGEVPTVPLSPEEIAAEARRAWEAGAAVVHVTARESGGGPSYRVERWREVVQAVRDRCEALVSVSTAAFGVGLEDRAAALEARPDCATVPIGSRTVARYNPSQRRFDHDVVFANPFAHVLRLLHRMRELGIRPVVAAHGAGDLAAARLLEDMGALPGGVPRNLVVGTVGGIPAQPRALCHVADDAGGPWTLVAPGPQWTLAAAALSLGGHLRVGFEDGAVLPSGEPATSNAELVEAAVALCRAVGSEPASTEEARERFGL